MIDKRTRKYFQKYFDTLALKLIKYKIKPNHVSIIALILGILASITYLINITIIIPLILLWLSGLCDVIDGTIARLNKQSSSLGTLIDIVGDRIVEVAIIIVIVLKNPYVNIEAIILLSVILISITIFLCVGAICANDSTKTFKYQAGLAERTEGFIMFSLMILFNQYLSFIMIIFIIMIVITIIQRIVEAYCLLKENK